MAGNFVADLLRRIGGALFRADEEFARRHSWQVQTGRFGLSRTIRHSGFDSLVGCQDCHGLGKREAADCGRCAGTGRLTLNQPSRADRR